MTMGNGNAGGIICPLYASRDGHRAYPDGGSGRGKAPEGTARPCTTLGSPRAGQGTLQAGIPHARGGNPSGMGNGSSDRSLGSMGHRHAGRGKRQGPLGAKPTAAQSARAGLMMCVGALVVAAMIRQYEVWPSPERPSVLHADVVPGIMPDDPIVTFRIGQR